MKTLFNVVLVRYTYHVSVHCIKIVNLCVEIVIELIELQLDLYLPVLNG